uniref:hypothetical protein n=1 Tax=Leptospira alexanderi TaxID=100053 RepID=UPI001C3794A4
MILKKTLLFSFLILFLIDCLPGTVRFSSSVSGVLNTYIKFKMPNMKNLNSKLIDVYANPDSYVFFSELKENGLYANMHFTSFDTGYLNPGENYYHHKQDGLYRNIFSQIFLGGNMRIRFLQDCEYRMPAPVGKKTYIFGLNFQAYRRSGSLESEFDLPPNHSIRLNFVPKDIEVAFVPFSEEAFKDPKDRKVI